MRVRSTASLAFDILTNVLPSLQFTDFHKFLVSAGGLSCVAAGTLPIFLLRTQKTVSLTSKQLSELNADARTATEMQQAQLLWLLRAWPWVSASLLVVGLALVTIGAIQWRKRQDVLNNKDAAEISKLNSEREKADAEKEKVYQESIALSKANQESLAEGAKSIEEKAAEASADLGPERTDDGRANDDIDVVVLENTGSRIPALDLRDATTDALRMILAASQDLPARTRGYIEEITALELTAGAIQRALPDASITRDVRIGSTRADFVITSRENYRYDLVVDVRRIAGKSPRDRLISTIHGWASDVARTDNPVPTKNYRPLSIVIIPEGPEWHESGNRLSLLAERFVSNSSVWGLYGSLPLTVLLVKSSLIERKDARLAVLNELPPEDSRIRVVLVQDVNLSSVIAESGSADSDR